MHADLRRLQGLESEVVMGPIRTADEIAEGGFDGTYYDGSEWQRK